MQIFPENTDLPEDFSGEVRLFPLPNVVCFPHAILPLHLFEPRYCQLLTESLQTDRLIAMALLKPGWEADYEGRPAIQSVVCLGQIITHAATPEGTHNILLRGVQRARVIRELPVDAAFRRAQVELLPETLDPTLTEERSERQRRMIDLFRRFLPRSEQWEQQLDQLLSRPLALGILTDLIAFATRFSVEHKQQLLTETNADARSRMLIELLERTLRHPEQAFQPGTFDFPPRFSEN